MKVYSPTIRAQQGNGAVDAIGGPGRPIGEFMRNACKLDEGQILKIVAHHRKSGLRFGEAAVALRLANRRDVLEALSRQFQYNIGFSGQQANGELVAAIDPFGDQADAFRELRSRLLLEVLGDRPHGALAVVSPDVGDGKTYTAANLAVAFSQLGERTLLIDADMRTPRQHGLLGVAPRAGLSNVLAGLAEPGATISPVPGLPSLFLMPAGAVPPNPLELLQRTAFGMLVRDMLEQFEHVLIDTAAATRGADSRVVAAQCSAALVLARTGRSRMDHLEGLLAALARGPAKIAGIVMNDH